LGLRLGLAGVRGVDKRAAQRVVAARAGGPFRSLEDLARRAELTGGQMEALATAGALVGLVKDRRRALWAAGVVGGADMLPGTAVGLDAPPLAAMSQAELALADVWATGVTVAGYPTTLVRADLDRADVLRLDTVQDHPDGAWIKVAGVVTHRQRPSTARGVTFLSLEDESGQLNVTCTPDVWNKFRLVGRAATALVVTGRLEKADGATGIKAAHLHPLYLPVNFQSRDFR
jgi:error-prone DNA polymerase